MDIKDVIKHIRKWPSESDAKQEMIIWLQELAELRESEPRPTMFSKTNSVRQQFEHLRSEVCEIATALVDFEDGGSKEELALELEDLKHSCTTMQAGLGYDAGERRQLSKKVIAKNVERGYYGEVKDE